MTYLITTYQTHSACYFKQRVRGSWLTNYSTVLLVIIGLLVSPAKVDAAFVNFDQFPGMNFLGGAVPIDSRLSNQLQPTTGAVFSTLGGADYVGVANLEIGSPSPHAPSPSNGIGGVTATGSLFYGIPIKISFFDLTSTTMAVTDFVSIVGDLRPISGDIILKAFDVNGSLLGFDQQPDSPGGREVSISIPGIHFITVESTSGTVAFDNLNFNDVSAVPVPAAVWLFVSGLLVVSGFAKKRRQ